MAAKMEITLSTYTEDSDKQERHIIMKLEEKRGPPQQKAGPDPELSRQSFRHFSYQEVSGPQEALSRLRQLCRQWLQPDLHTKEQILELLVMEQFLVILPPEIQAQVRHRYPMSGKEIVTLVEDLHRASKKPKQWVRRVFFSVCPRISLSFGVVCCLMILASRGSRGMDGFKSRIQPPGTPAPPKKRCDKVSVYPATDTQ